MFRPGLLIRHLWPALRTAAIEDCAPFVEARRVLSIEGHEVSASGDRAFAATAAGCAAGRSIHLRFEDGGRAKIGCNEPLPPSPRPLDFPEP